MKDIDFSQSVLTFFLNIPLFAIIGYFLHRANLRRDEFEKETINKLHLIDVRTALIEKEAEFNKILYKNVLDLQDKTKKNEKDINECFERIREFRSNI